MAPKISIIDYDAGNLRNVQKAVEHLGFRSGFSRESNTVKDSDILILPGVGAFADGMQTLRRLGLEEAIKEEVMANHKPILGICLGMQLLAQEGDEGGYTRGLGLLPMTIQRLPAENQGLRLPHIGWNNITAERKSILFAGIPENADFYFVHSYHAVCSERDVVAAKADYGEAFVAAVEWKNIFATQFHPEKSQRYGLQLLKNFLKYCTDRP